MEHFPKDCLLCPGSTTTPKPQVPLNLVEVLLSPSVSKNEGEVVPLRVVTRAQTHNMEIQTDDTPRTRAQKEKPKKASKKKPRRSSKRQRNSTDQQQMGSGSQSSKEAHNPTTQEPQRTNPPIVEAVGDPQ